MGITERVDAAIDAALERRIVGCVILINQDGKEIYARAAGLADREDNRPMQRDAIFRLASVTKPIVATTVLRLVDLGLIGLNDRVTRYLPWFTPANPDGSPADIRIRHLLSHSSGLSYGRLPADASGGLSGVVNTLTETLQNIARVPLAFAPGRGWDYGTSIDVLGGVLAAINGSNVEDAITRYVSGPLGMVDTHFHVTDGARLATPYADGNPPVRMGDPHPIRDAAGTVTTFSPSRIFNPSAPQNGGSGTYARGLQMAIRGYSSRRRCRRRLPTRSATCPAAKAMPANGSDSSVPCWPTSWRQTTPAPLAPWTGAAPGVTTG